MENLNEKEFFHATSKQKQELLRQIGQEILRVRSKQNLTLDRIAVLSGGYINKHQLERVEMGKSEPSLYTLIALGLLFNKKLTIRFE